jgi:hypothetical protein
MVRIPGTAFGHIQLEDLSTDQLFGIFEYSGRTTSRAVPPAELAEVWGLFFSGLFLSAEELVSGMQGGENPLREDRQQVLRDFIRADCERGGAFVLAVIRSGGKIDRAALVMIACLEDLAGVESKGSTALHLLAAACDRRLRPALIERAGKKALGSLFNVRGSPVLFTILALNDLTREDLAAIEKMFTRDELRSIKNKKRTGRNALQIFYEAQRRLKVQGPGERNAFSLTRAVKNTNLSGDIGLQIRSRESGGGESHLAGADVMGGSRNKADGESERTGAAERYDALMTQPLDNFRALVHRKTGPK